MVLSVFSIQKSKEKFSTDRKTEWTRRNKAQKINSEKEREMNMIEQFNECSIANIAVSIVEMAKKDEREREKEKTFSILTSSSQKH